MRLRKKSLILNLRNERTQTSGRVLFSRGKRKLSFSVTCAKEMVVLDLNHEKVCAEIVCEMVCWVYTQVVSMFVYGVFLGVSLTWYLARVV